MCRTGSTTDDTISTTPLRWTSGSEGLVISATAPAWMSTASASNRSATTQTDDRSAMVASGPPLPGPTSWPLVTSFSTSTPSVGAVTVNSLSVPLVTLSAFNFAPASFSATWACRNCCRATTSSFAGSEFAATMACTRSNCDFATARSTCAFSSSARSSAMLGLATVNSGCPAFTLSPSST